MLAHQGIDARVVEIHTLKPFDAQAIVTAAEETGAIVTAEEHSIVGGLGGASSGARVDLPGNRSSASALRTHVATSGPYL